MSLLGDVVKVGTLGLVDPDAGPDAAKDAAKAQAGAAGEASRITQEMFEQTRQDFGPSRAIGTNALFTLASSLGQTPTLEQLGLQMGLNEQQMAQLLGTSPAGGGTAAEPFVTRNFASGSLADTLESLKQSRFGTQQAGQAGTSTSTGFDPDVELVRSMFNQQRPASLDEMVKADPGFQFRMDQGQKAIERSAAARGGLFSGKTGKGLMDFAQGLASQETGNAFNRLAALAGIGQTANQNVASLGAQSAGQRADFATQAGNARASGFIGAFNANPLSANNLLSLAGQGAGAFLGGPGGAALFA